MLFRLVVAALLCSPLALAIQEADVGVIDWHTKLVGVPLAPPIIHHSSNGSVIIVPTTSNVLAALNAADGSVAWRYVFDAADGLANIRVDSDSDFVAAQSGPGASMLRIFNVNSGLIEKEQRVEGPEGALKGVDVAESKYVLQSTVIQRVDEHPWRWEIPVHDRGPYQKLVSTDTALYAVGHNVDSPTVLHFASIDRANGSTIHTSWKHLPPRVSSFVVAGTVVAWVQPESHSLGFLELIPSLKSNIRTEDTLKWTAIVDVNLQNEGFFVGVYASGEAKLLKVQPAGVIESVHTFPANEGSQSLFAGGIDEKGNIFVARLWGTAQGLTRVDVVTPGEATVEHKFFVDPSRHGTITHLSVDGTRLVITTSTGSLQLWEGSKLVWAREEGLASIDVAAFVELPLPERVARDVTGEESFVSRIQRQISDARDFPAYAVAFAQRFVGGSEDVAVVAAASDARTPLTRDVYGFHQVLVVATPYGSVSGIDTVTGAIIWTRVFGLGWANEVGGTVRPLKIFVLNGADEKKEVVIIAQRRAENASLCFLRTLVDTVLFRIDPLTGQSVFTDEEDTSRIVEGQDVVRGPLAEALMLPDSDVLILIDEFSQIVPYPDTESSKQLIASLSPSVFLPMLKSFADGPRVVGHGIKLDLNLSDRYLAYQTWSLNLPQGEVVTRLVRPRVGPVVSYGKVLGNRTTLYKYLNPRMFVVLTQGAQAPEPGCGLYVVDGAKGSVLYSVVVPSGGKAVCDVQAMLTENWLVYHYYDGQGVATGQTKGWKLVTVELYEGGVDEKTLSSEMSAFSEDVMRVDVLEQSYVYPYGVNAITTTSTKFGITTKNIIVATNANKIQELQRRMLNPRRPKDRKPTAEEQQEEHLIPYDLLIPDEPRRTLSHQYDVRGTRNIITAPALLESTSLVFAYGLDLFFTRVAPSNTFDILSKGFNKLQLVLTVSALAAGIAVTRPMVQKKRLREKWYQ
ncbi:hypothetical protein HMN09_01351100 [Mycena chlorophos]|uniref:ER membrane protein complex subunit 1 n=1 Tax=Mycena chlorophos TaxID=658473 RepID=A0A8H6RZ44_MYCCL|nr:hypothetical protein HMN09_01351100 [Mycena chlorophos]